MVNLIPWKSKRRSSAEGQSGSLPAVRGELDRLLENSPFGALDWPVFGEKAWMPAVDLVNGETEVAIRAEVPGIDPKDLDVTILGNQIVIRGEKKESSERQEGGCSRSECRYGSFSRSVGLPDGLDTEHVEAEYANGVLTLRLKKLSPTTAKRVEVKVNP
jgi:HSP20 family protein